MIRRLATLAAFLVLGTASAADSIVLKAVVRLPAETSSVKLGDIAYLEGEEALRLADVEVARLDERPTVELPLEEIRAKLTAAKARWASIDLSGRTVTVRRPIDGRPLAMRGMTVEDEARPRIAPPSPEEKIAAREREVFLADSVVGAMTPRGLIAELVRNVHAAKGTQVRLSIDGADAALLDDTDPAHRYEIIPLTSLSADRIMVRIVTRADDKVLARRDVSVVPTLETQVATATRSIRRGMDIDADAYTVAAEFVSPTEFGRLAPATSVQGAAVTDAINQGERITQDKLRRAIEIRRNDKVTVRREMGMVAIELAAIAIQDGSVGDEIQLQVVDRKNRKDKRVFTAVVTGPGRAVLREDA